MGRIGRTAGMIAFLLTVVTSGVYPPPVGAGSEPVIVADLGGQPIPAVDVSRYHCEDLDFPRIHCYALAGDRDRAVAGRLAVQATGGLAIDATAYVLIFQDAQFAGPSAYLTVAYDDLSVIGWNDRISSFKGQGGSGGTFFEHIYGGGFAYPFNAGQSVSYVGDPYNDKFSSVKPR